MKKLLFIYIAFFISGCVGPVKEYKGPVLPEDQLSTYSRWNYTSFSSSMQIYTMEMNGVNLELAGSVGSIPAPGGIVHVKPGVQRVKISFVDGNNIFLPAFYRANTFAGWYEIEFIAKPAMLYAPIFNQNFEGKEQLKSMCIAEVPVADGISATRETNSYVACAEPSIEPTEINKKLCSDDWSTYNLTACKH